MCGIIGYVGGRNAAPILLQGLRQLEHRGYDSAGLALVKENALVVIKRAGRVERVAMEVQKRELTAHIGIAHTRWATHGEKSDRNAHPHTDCSNTIAVVHNGQIENFSALREMLTGAGHTFRTETDTEVIPHLIEKFRTEGADLTTAVRSACALLEGAYAIAAVDTRQPDTVAGACQGSPLVVGTAEHGTFLASEVLAFIQETDKYQEVHDGETVTLRVDTDPVIVTANNETMDRAVQATKIRLSEIEKGSFPTFMEKEIAEQPEVIERALEGRISPEGTVRIGGIDRFPDFADRLRHIRSVRILAEGTSLYAGLAISRFFQELGFAAAASAAAEFEHSPYPLPKDTLVVGITQSGETRDLAVPFQRFAKAGYPTFLLCNRPGATLTRIGSGMYLKAGTEIGVASTKAFTAEIICGGILALALKVHSNNPIHAARFRTQAINLSHHVRTVLHETDRYLELGRSLATVKRFLYIGRGYNLPVALEGALKMMEITHLDAHGMSAASMKHGPLSLVGKETVVVAVVLPDPRYPEVYERTLSNINQVLSRQGRVIAVVANDDNRIGGVSSDGRRIDHIIRIPTGSGSLLDCITATVPLQLMAVGAARELGRDVDKPEKLAKSVTVD
jgi:glucosamine--fructose-6-phosphate aminotransferase (isomerizing)